MVPENQLRVAFDGDAVLFSDESEQIVKAHGLDMFFEHEKTYENKPLAQVRHQESAPGTGSTENGLPAPRAPAAGAGIGAGRVGGG